MGGCASVQKSMRAEIAADVAAPEPPKEAAEVAPAAAPEDNKAEDGDDKHEIKAVEVETPKEAAKVEVENSKTDAPVEAAPVAATIEEEKKKEVAEQK